MSVTKAYPYNIKNIQNGYILIVRNITPDVFTCSLADGVYLFQ